MNVLCAFVLLASIMSALIFACDLNDSEIMICAKDVEQFCQVELFPYTVQSISDSRDCLRQYRDSISQECLDYLQLDKPSIIESCLTEMYISCSNVVPGCFNLNSCLSGVAVEDLSPDCQETLLNEQEMMTRNEENVLPPYRVAVWNWTKSFAEISKYLLTYISQISQQGNYLRGSIYIEIMGNDEEGSIYVSNDINTIDSNDHHQVDDENDDESDSTTLNDLKAAN